MKRNKKYRSAVTGKFVSKKQAEKNPRETIGEHKCKNK